MNFQKFLKTFVLSRNLLRGPGINFGDILELGGCKLFS